MLDQLKPQQESSLEKYFQQFRKNIIGDDLWFNTPYGRKKMLYADWIASGRMYGPIEKIFVEEIMPYVANTHTETTTSGCSMTLAYLQARDIIKRHVNANEDDILISSNSGMTGVVNKLQRIIGFRLHEKYLDSIDLDEKPLVICTHMEHHSNQTSWLETIADVRVIDPCPEGRVDCEKLEKILEEYKDRKIKIAAVTSCSNVTGVFSPYYEIAECMHKHGGLCFVDFACSAPYIDIDMHPEDRPEAYLDAVYFSPHKFLGGPGSTGILLFNKKLYSNRIPDNPGGGTVDWTNPWGEHKYYDEIEAREDGGTPAFLQTIRVAYAIMLKEKIGTDNIKKREEEMIEYIWPKLKSVKDMIILADNIQDRLGVVSFYFPNIHFNLVVKLLNDRFGIQTRGGCSCAGTYGHYLLAVTEEQSKEITDRINTGDLTLKPGWIRLSLHPTMTNKELDFIVDALNQVSNNYEEWSQDYIYHNSINEFVHKDTGIMESRIVQNWFDKDLL